MKLFQLLKRYDDTHNFTCDICGSEVFAGERVCKPCMNALPWNLADICPVCGRAVGEPGVCLDCKEDPFPADKGRSCFVHEGEVARLVMRFKRGVKYLFRAMAELALPFLQREFPDADALTFIPMTERAEKLRGYNQSRLLAEELAIRSEKEFISPAVKVRETSAQKALGRKDRAENLKGCFKLTDRSSVKGKRILIVDDTLTTGATAGELSSLFYRAGAELIYLLTITSVPRKNPFGK